MAYVDFKHLREAVSLEVVLAHYGIELRRVNARSLRGRCPLPMHGSEASTTSFTATLSKGLGGVWACQSQSCVAARNGKKGGNALDFVATMENCDLQTAAAKMQSWFNITNDVPVKSSQADRSPNRSELVSKESMEARETGTEKNEPIKFTLKGIDPTHPYLKSRGVSEEMARAFGIGYFSGRGTMKDRIVFEIRNESGELVGYAGRVINDSEPRYKFPAGFYKSLELYNLHRVIAELGDATKRRRVVIVEGFFACLRVIAAGFPCVALMGNSMSEAQEELIIRHFNVACILLDGNDAGRQGSADCLARLGRHMFVYAPELAEGKQPDSLCDEELCGLIKK
jgi:DNA primase